MPLSKADKARLKEQGFSPRDIKGIESAMTTEPDEPADDGAKPPKRKPAPKSTPGRVVVMEGDQATSFLDKLFGPGAAAADDEPDEPDDADGAADGDDDDDPDGDDDDPDGDDDQDHKPPPGHRYFRP